MKLYYVRPLNADFLDEDKPGGINKRVGTLDGVAAQYRLHLVNLKSWEAQLADAQRLRKDASAQKYAQATRQTEVKAVGANRARARAVGQTVLQTNMPTVLGAHQDICAADLSIEDYQGKIASERLLAFEAEQKLKRQGVVLNSDNTIDWGKSSSSQVKRLQPTELEKWKIHFKGGDLCLSTKLNPNATLQTLVPYDTSRLVTQHSGAGFAIYVMTTAGDFYVHSHSVGDFHHSTFLGNTPVGCAGELKVLKGRLQLISNKSGHFWPSAGHLLQALEVLHRNKVPDTYQVDLLAGGDLDGIYKDRPAFVAAALGKDLDLEIVRLLAYWRHLGDAELLRGRGVRWASPGESNGVYIIASGQPIYPREVRRWLKSEGKMPEAYC